MTERTVVILKPDAVVRGLTGKITSRLEEKGLKLVASKMQTLTEDILKVHYAHHAEKPFFGEIVEYMTSAPVVLQVWEGEESASIIRQMMGVTNASQAQPGTIRGDYAMSIRFNLVHGSETAEIAEEEVARFFTEDELHTYKRVDEDVL